jgi:uncharacterized protein involved in exopolysaccharide biosynthesis
MTVYDNDEIDLRPYLKGLIRKWWIIILIAVACASLSFIFSRSIPENYEAVAVILLTKQTSKLNLASQFPTTTEPTSNQSRAETILSIAESDTTTLQVWEAVKEKWTGDTEPTMNVLKGMVKFEVKGDTLLVTAASSDAAFAELLANTWTQILIDSINQAYSGEQPLSTIQAQRESAQMDYESAQTALENFLQTSQLEALQQKIDDLNILSTGQTNDNQMLYTYYQNRKNEMLALQIQAEALKAQIQQGNQSTSGEFGDALAMLFARATVLSPRTDSTNIIGGRLLTVQINDVEALSDSTQNYIADIETIISQAQAEQEKAETTLQELSQSVLDNVNDPILEETFAQLRQAKAQYENEQALYTELKNSRDLNWTAYQALLAKETEIKNAPKSSNVVVLLNNAILPEVPASRGTLKNTVIGGAAGFFISVVFILANVWWKSADLFSDEKNEKISSQAKKQA